MWMQAHWWMWVVVAAIVVPGWIANARYRRRSASARSGFRPRNSDPWVRLWRQRRADEGKSDPAFLRHGLGVDYPNEHNQTAEAGDRVSG